MPMQRKKRKRKSYKQQIKDQQTEIESLRQERDNLRQQRISLLNELNTLRANLDSTEGQTAEYWFREWESEKRRADRLEEQRRLSNPFLGVIEGRYKALLDNNESE